MGIAQAGLVFRPNIPIEDMSGFISTLFGERVNSLPHPNVGSFDIRHHSDVMVELYGDVCFIANHDLVWDILENHQSDATQLYERLRAPSLIVVYCHYDSGGSYGYAFIENGKRTRSRLQTTGDPKLPPIIEAGEPKPIELEWLNASSYIEEDDCPVEERQRLYYKGDREIEVAEYHLTSRMLDEMLESYFAVRPWDTELKPVHHFFKLSGRQKPWWKVW